MTGAAARTTASSRDSTSKEPVATPALESDPSAAGHGTAEGGPCSPPKGQHAGREAGADASCATHAELGAHGSTAFFPFVYSTAASALATVAAISPIVSQLALERFGPQPSGNGTHLPREWCVVPKTTLGLLPAGPLRQPPWGLGPASYHQQAARYQPFGGYMGWPQTGGDAVQTARQGPPQGHRFDPRISAGNGVAFNGGQGSPQVGRRRDAVYERLARHHVLGFRVEAVPDPGELHLLGSFVVLWLVVQRHVV